jgi:hypothetical protein
VTQGLFLEDETKISSRLLFPVALLKTSECEFATDVLLIRVDEDRVCSSELARTAPIDPGGQSANIPVKMMTSVPQID